MKEIDLSDVIRKGAQAGRENRKNANWPMCMTCLRDVDAANIEAVSNNSCEIRVKCHGAEDSKKVRWDGRLAPNSNADDILSDPHVGWAIKRALVDGVYFEPTHSFDFSSKR